MSPVTFVRPAHTRGVARGVARGFTSRFALGLELSLALGLALSASAGASQAAGRVTVTAKDPALWSDAGATPDAAEDTLRQLRAHLVQLGTAGLKSDQTLSVEFLDVDLAGRTRPSARTAQELRVVRGGADWPRIALHYRLEAAGTLLGEGDEQLADLDYLRASAIKPTGGPFGHEKRLLDRWFRQRIAPLAAQAP